jgi:hypothetical protein
VGSAYNPFPALLVGVRRLKCSTPDQGALVVESSRLSTGLMRLGGSEVPGMIVMYKS